MNINPSTLPLPTTVPFMSDEAYNQVINKTLPHMPPVYNGCRPRKWSNLEVLWLTIYVLWSGVDATDVAVREGCKPRVLQKWLKIGRQALLNVLPVLPDGEEIRSREQVIEWCEHVSNSVIVDGTEIQVARPESKVNHYGSKQKEYYSGSKQTHTVKVQVLADEEGNLLDVGDAVPGSVHDYRLFENSGWLENFQTNTDLTVGGDSAYVALDKVLKNALTPRKKERGKQRTDADKFWNKLVASWRVAVEHAICKLKRFKSLRKVKLDCTRVVQTIRLAFILTTYRQAYPQGSK